MMATYTLRKKIRDEVDRIIMSLDPFVNPYPLGSEESKIFQEEARKHILYSVKMSEERSIKKIVRTEIKVHSHG